jgi:hypothetical protein
MPESDQTMFPLLLLLLSRKKKKVAGAVLTSLLPVPQSQRSVLALVQADREARRADREDEALAREAGSALADAVTRTASNRLFKEPELAAFPRLNALLSRPALAALRTKIVAP